MLTLTFWLTASPASVWKTLRKQANGKVIITHAHVFADRIHERAEARANKLPSVRGCYLPHNMAPQVPCCDGLLKPAHVFIPNPENERVA